MPDEIILRSEFEARHAELRTDIKAVELKVDILTTSVLTIGAANRIAFWKLVATTLIALLTGSVGTIVVEYLTRIHP
jgi:hypothetical protein